MLLVELLKTADMDGSPAGGRCCQHPFVNCLHFVPSSFVNCTNTHTDETSCLLKVSLTAAELLIIHTRG